MNQWTITQNNHFTGAISVREQDGVVILTAHVGRYPTAVSTDGRSTDQIPHILISVSGWTEGGIDYFSGVTVQALSAPAASGQRKYRQVFSDVRYDGSRRDITPDAWVALAETKISDAIAALNGLDAQYEAASRALKPAYTYQAPLSRAEYEAACAACGVEALSDADCRSYGVKYGVFTFPEYSADFIAKMHLAAWRWVQIRDDKEAEKQSAPREPGSPPAKLGQLWEPCERCGCEPVYMPLHLCEKCWPASAAPHRQ